MRCSIFKPFDFFKFLPCSSLCILIAASNATTANTYGATRTTVRVKIAEPVRIDEPNGGIQTIRKVNLTKPTRFAWHKVVQEILLRAKLEPSTDFETALSNMKFNLKLMKEIEDRYGQDQSRGAIADIYNQDSVTHDKIFAAETVTNPTNIRDFRQLVSLAHSESWPSMAEQAKIHHYIMNRLQYERLPNGELKLRTEMDQALLDLIRRKPEFVDDTRNGQFIDFRMALILHGFKNMAFTSRKDLEFARSLLDDITWGAPFDANANYTAHEHQEVFNWYKAAIYRTKVMAFESSTKLRSRQEILKAFPVAVVLEQIIQGQNIAPGSNYFVVQFKRFPMNKLDLFDRIAKKLVSLGLITEPNQANPTDSFEVHVTTLEQASFMLELLERNALYTFDVNGNEAVRR